MKLLIVIILLITNIYIQAQDSLKLGLENSMEYNFRIPRNVNFGNIKRFSVVRESILLVGLYKDHTFLIGPHISKFHGFLYSPDDEISKNEFGLHFGYQNNYLLQKLNNTFVVTRLTFSIYHMKFQEISIGPPNKEIKKTTILENNLYFGLKKQFFSKFYVQSGFGIGSTQGFFLMLETFMLSSSIGIGLQF